MKALLRFSMLFLFANLFSSRSQAQMKHSEVLNDTTGFIGKELSVSWYFGGNQVLYRKQLSSDSDKSKWRRYGGSISIEGGINLQNQNSTYLYGYNSFEESRANLSALIGLESRRPSKVIGLEYYTGFDMQPYFQHVFRKIYAETTVASNKNIADKTIGLGLGIAPFVGIRYKITERISISAESGVYAYVKTNFAHIKDTSNATFTRVTRNAWFFNYGLYSTPLKAFWITYAF